ncbi:hypothetical protein EMIT0111MI5_10655 [Burkholderia sp. IT-111MI5]
MNFEVRKKGRGIRHGKDSGGRRFGHGARRGRGLPAQSRARRRDGRRRQGRAREAQGDARRAPRDQRREHAEHGRPDDGREDPRRTGEHGRQRRDADDRKQPGDEGARQGGRREGLDREAVQGRRGARRAEEARGLTRVWLERARYRFRVRRCGSGCAAATARRRAHLAAETIARVASGG